MSDNDMLNPGMEDEVDVGMYNTHYIRTREDGCIVDGWSNGAYSDREATEEDIVYNTKGGYHFRLIIDGVPSDENPNLIDTRYGIPLYRYENHNTYARTDEEMKPERDAVIEEMAREQRLSTLHANLDNTDYIDNKIVEALVTNGMEAAQAMADEYSDLINQRQQWRDEINQLET